jgi:hypothetical protein
MLRKLVLFAALLLSFTLPVTGHPDTCASTSGASPKLVLSIAKNLFVEQEPIVIIAALTNDSGQTRRLAEPSWGRGIVKLRITKLTDSGAVVIPTEDDSRIALPADYGWDFAPHETRCAAIRVDRLLPTSDPVGRYELRAAYFPPGEAVGVWHGTLVSSPVCFSIRKAIGADATRAGVFAEAAKMARRKLPNPSGLDLAERLSALKQPSQGGMFAAYAGFEAAQAYWMAGDMDGFIAAMQCYLRDHPSVPYFSQEAVQELVHALFHDKKDYVAARPTAMKMENGWERQNWIRKCDAAIAKQMK